MQQPVHRQLGYDLWRAQSLLDACNENTGYVLNILVLRNCFVQPCEMLLWRVYDGGTDVLYTQCG